MRYTTTLILAVIVFIAAALIYVYRDQLTGEAKPPEKPSETKALIENVKVDDLASATVEERAKDGKMAPRLALKKVDGQWRITAPLEGAADDYEVSRLLRAALDGRYRTTIEPGKKGQPTLEALGLEPAPLQLVLTTKENEKDKKPARTVTIAIGRRPSFGEGLYVRLADQPKAVVLERADLLDRAKEKTNAYRSRELVSVGREDVVRIDLAGEKGTIELNRDAKERDRWVLAKPLASRADPDATAALVRAALGLSAKEFVEDNPKDLAAFGLDQPRLTLTLYKLVTVERTKAEAEAAPNAEPRKEPAKVATLKFGAWADPRHDTVYLLTNDGKQVVAVDAAAYKDLAKSATDLRDRHVLALDTSRANKVTVKLPAKLSESKTEVAYELVKDGAAWKVHVEGRPDAKADPATVEFLLKELAELRVLYFAEGEHADVAKGFAPIGSVRVQLANDAVAQGLDIGGAGDAPSLVKNVREDWIGRINEKTLNWVRKDGLDFLDKQVLAVDPKKVTTVAIQTPDRKIVLEKKNDKWQMTEPTSAEPEPAYAGELMRNLQDLRCEKYVAATKDFKAYKLDPGLVVCTVTQAAEAKDAKPTEKVLHLAQDEKAKIVGRVDGSDLVFELSMAAFAALSGEPLDKKMTSVSMPDVKELEIATPDQKTRLLKIDQKWYRADASGAPGEGVQDEAVNDILQNAGNLLCARWASYEAKDLPKFGLDKPAVRIKLSTDKTATTILISAKEPPADLGTLVDQKPVRYVFVEGGQRVGLVAGRPAEVLLGAAKALEPKKPDEAKPEEKKPAAKKAAAPADK